MPTVVDFRGWQVVTLLCSSLLCVLVLPFRFLIFDGSHILFMFYCPCSGTAADCSCPANYYHNITGMVCSQCHVRAASAAGSTRCYCDDGYYGPGHICTI